MIQIMIFTMKTITTNSFQYDHFKNYFENHKNVTH